MTKIRNYIGIDISKDWLDVAVLRNRRLIPVYEGRFANDLKDLRKLKTALHAIKVPLNRSSLVICENTGIYKNTLVSFVKKQSCLFSVEVPQRIKQSLGMQRGKNDKIDARRIAQYAISNSSTLTIWKSPRKEIQTLKDLLINRDRAISVE